MSCAAHTALRPGHTPQPSHPRGEEPSRCALFVPLPFGLRGNMDMHALPLPAILGKHFRATRSPSLQRPVRRLAFAAPLPPRIAYRGNHGHSAITDQAHVGRLPWLDDLYPRAVVLPELQPIVDPIIVVPCAIEEYAARMIAPYLAQLCCVQVVGVCIQVGAKSRPPRVTCFTQLKRVQGV
jgi:hypothetical protein